jgi:2-polyprenyl-6-hydroxyphenyl methylase/3-demethylubiquinone-9 3-methyltransferase
MNNKITFSFGKNWSKYAITIDDLAINLASQDIDEWLGKELIRDKKVLDIGSGSGIHSLVFFKNQASQVLSFDYDIYSVETTKSLWDKEGKPSHWQVIQGSILDDIFTSNLGGFDIVYAWGVLHHTGAMWEAIKKTLSLVNSHGYLFMSLYTKGPNYQKHLALKQRYNNSSLFEKKYLEYKCILGVMKHRLKTGQNPFKWNQKKERGMNIYHDIIDWLGGLPYEVASPSDVVTFCQNFNFELKKIKELEEGGCSQYLFQKKDK